jgi:CRP-like cAMP-binding protein
VDEESVRSTTVVALEPGETYAVGREAFSRLRDRYPVVNELLVRLLAQRLRRANERLLESLFVPAEARVLRRLGELATRTSGKPALVALTQEDLAGLAGTSRATVNRLLRAEEKRGLLELKRGRIVVLDPTALARRAETPLL